MFLIVDVGNTRVKSAVYEEGKIAELFVFAQEEMFQNFEKILSKYSITHSIISSVASFTKLERDKLRGILSPIFLSSTTKLPFINLYRTPDTLGVDRIALAAAAQSKFREENVLVIDAGTCITYDFISAEGKYLGGAISPGIEMRYKALHHFTSKLPLLSKTEGYVLLGTDTSSSIHSGILNGVYNEMNGLINQYREDYQDLTVVLTGGDTKFLAKQLKSVIFAQPNFVLEGLYTILIYNIADD